VSPRRIRPRAAVAAAAALFAVLGLVAACGVPSDSGPRDIPPDFALEDSAATSVAPVPATTGALVYFLGPVTDPTGRLRPITRDVQPVTTATVLQSLFDGLTNGEQARGLRTAIPEGTQLLDATTLPDGTARVNLNDAIFDASGEAQVDAVAQIVFAATSVPGTTQVDLLVNGQPRGWPRGDGSAEAGALTRYMYPDLDPTSRPDYPPFPVGGTTAPTPTTLAAGRR
jgi:Sporulation and spore germination